MHKKQIGTTLFAVLVAFVLLPGTTCHMHDVITALTASPDGKWLFTRSRYWLLRSEDGGDSWTPLREPDWRNGGATDEKKVRTFDLSPNFENDKTMAFGMHLSLDAGSTWAGQLNVESQRWGGIQYERCANPTVKFSPNFAEDKTIYTVARRRSNNKIAALLYSTDLGKTFAAVQNPLSKIPFESSFRCPVLTATADAIYLHIAGDGKPTTIFTPKIIQVSTPAWKRVFRSSEGGIDIQSVAVDKRTASSAAGNASLLLIDGTSQTLYQTDAYSGQTLRDSALTAITLPTPATKSFGDNKLIAAYTHEGVGSNSTMIVLRSSCVKHLGLSTFEGSVIRCKNGAGGAKTRDTSAQTYTQPDPDNLDYVLLSRDKGATWSKLTVNDWFLRDGGGEASAFGEAEFTHVVGIPGTPRIFLGTFTGLYRSDDHGDTWTELDTIHNDATGLDVAKLSEDRFQVSICTYDNGCWSGAADLGPLRDGSQSKLPDGFMARLYAPENSTDDKLATPLTLYLELDTPSDAAARCWRSDAYRVLGFSNGIGFLDTDSRYCERSAVAGSIWRSTDGFASWSNMSLVSLPLPEEVEMNKEVAVVKVHVIEYSPDFKDDGTLFVGGLGVGISRSNDSGLTFETVFNPYTTMDVNTQVSQMIVSPKFATDRTVYAHLTEGKSESPKINHVYVSRDAGSTWAESGAGFSDGMLSIAVTVDHNPKRSGDFALVGVHADGSVVVSRRGKKSSGRFLKWRPMKFWSTEKGKYTARHKLARKSAESGFCRDGILGAPDGTLFMSMLGGGVLKGQLRGTRFTKPKSSGLDQRWRLGGQNSLVEAHRKTFYNLIAASPDNKDDGVLFGVFYDELYVSLDNGVSWSAVNSIPSMGTRLPSEYIFNLWKAN